MASNTENNAEIIDNYPASVRVNNPRSVENINSAIGTPQVRQPTSKQFRPVAIDSTQDCCSSLGCSIFTTICCCLVLGIAAIIYSVKARNSYRMGLFGIAKIHNQRAKTFNIIGIFIGFIALVAYTIYEIVVLTKPSSSKPNGSYNSYG